ncbi:hypothetical protein EJB05_32286, partial [Eragrostis curvula]
MARASRPDGHVDAARIAPRRATAAHFGGGISRRLDHPDRRWPDADGLLAAAAVQEPAALLPAGAAGHGGGELRRGLWDDEAELLDAAAAARGRGAGEVRQAGRVERAAALGRGHAPHHAGLAGGVHALAQRRLGGHGGGVGEVVVVVLRRLPPRPRYVVVGYDDDAAKLSRSNRSELASLIASSSTAAATAGARRSTRSRPRSAAGGGSASITESSSMGRNTSKDARGGSSIALLRRRQRRERERASGAHDATADRRRESFTVRGNARLPGVTVTFTAALAAGSSSVTTTSVLGGGDGCCFAFTKIALSRHSSTADCALNRASVAGLLGSDAAAATAFLPAQGQSRQNSVQRCFLPPPRFRSLLALTAAPPLPFSLAAAEAAWPWPAESSPERLFQLTSDEAAVRPLWLVASAAGTDSRGASSWWWW